MSVDDVAQTISVKGPEGIEVFDVSESMFDEDYGIETVRPGDILEIEFEEKEGKKAAISVMLKFGTLPNETSPSATDEPAEKPSPMKSPEKHPDKAPSTN